MSCFSCRRDVRLGPRSTLKADVIVHLLGLCASLVVPCAYCGELAAEPDHFTGRGPDGRYFDPTLWVPSCPPCNKKGWALWCAAGVGLDAFEHHSPHEVRMERLGLSLTRLAAKQPAGMFGHFAPRGVLR